MPKFLKQFKPIVKSQNFKNVTKPIGKPKFLKQFKPIVKSQNFKNVTKPIGKV